MKKSNSLILASSEGIDYECARELCKTCDTLTLMARSQIKLDQAVQRLKNKH